MRFRLRTLLIVLALAPAAIWVSTVKVAEFIERNNTAYKPYPQPEQQPVTKTGPKKKSSP